MTTTETRRLRRFFGIRRAGEDCRLYLPTFRGPARSETRPASKDTVREASLRYPGHTFADRDARAAFYISSILSQAIDLNDIRWEEAGAFAPGQSGTIFLFGSRSNQAARWATGESTLGKFVQFEFGRKWSIRCAGDRVFSLTAPNTLSRAEYEKKTDYGVIGRFLDPLTRARIFLIAGLGSRATEGCAYYLAQHWKAVARKFRGKDFALVLKFRPPIDPKQSELVLALDHDHPDGFAVAL